jgi:beta-glucosidase
MSFSKDFTWGAATAAYQIEGAFNADGKGPSVWDQMVGWTGKIHQGQTGDVTCDHYHRLEEDLDLMAAIGLTGYRFSFSWPRIFPEGIGRVNEPGLAFYDRLIDGLLERGIRPWGTLFHWCYPLALYHRGGWLNPDSPQWFADYAALMARRFGDRVTEWMTLNEPQMFINLGHKVGCHAPGVILPNADIARMIHHVLLAHGKANQALREHCAKTPTVGWAPAIGVHSVDPAYAEDNEVIEAARRGQFEFDAKGQIAKGVSVWCDPVFLQKYPDAFLEKFAGALPAGWEDDMETIGGPVDFCGMNVYAAWVRHSRSADGTITHALTENLGDEYPKSFFGWPVTPEALYWGPRFLFERYGKPIVITENGVSTHDWVALDGKVHDLNRVDFTQRYLRELRRAAEFGIPVQGYFHWSLMDNFEWAEGFKHRFGLIHLNYTTGQRTLKESAYWYRGVIQANGANL